MATLFQLRPMVNALTPSLCIIHDNSPVYKLAESLLRQGHYNEVKFVVFTTSRTTIIT